MIKSLFFYKYQQLFQPAARLLKLRCDSYYLKTTLSCHHYSRERMLMFQDECCKRFLIVGRSSSIFHLHHAWNILYYALRGAYSFTPCMEHILPYDVCNMPPYNIRGKCFIALHMGHIPLGHIRVCISIPATVFSLLRLAASVVRKRKLYRKMSNEEILFSELFVYI